MPTKHVLVKNLVLRDLMPMLQNWFSDQGYEVNTVANRIDAIIDGITLKILIEDYGKSCTVSISGPLENLEKVTSYISEISELGYTSAPCEYCGTLFSTEQSICPHCGAPRKTKKTSRS
jgi:hypothetical protein